ncbi:Rv0361 family membrane protein [Catenuloplanes japonicus]|uniref:Rv0361 family membrane protein n=1 Tax=Catenuloplanes japonicus TaxID=33876 RepID=UPI000525ECFF|nr:hypothetical protein [Catenuloplanes japonicus]
MTPRHRRARLDLSGLAFIAAVVAGVVLLIYGLLHRDGGPERLRAAATAYLDAVVAGDTARAWDLACGAEHLRGPRSSWSPVADLPLAAYTITAVDTFTGNPRMPSTHVVTVAVTYRGVPDGTPPTVRKIEITKEIDEWRACPRTPL